MRPQPKPTPPSLRKIMVQRQRQLHARRRIEQSFVLGAVRDHLHNLGQHPCLAYVLSSRWPHATVDDPELPSDWIEKAALKCDLLLRQHPWDLVDPEGGDSLPPEKLKPLARVLWSVRQSAGIER
jgi:hypothetical protein